MNSSSSPHSVSIKPASQAAGSNSSGLEIPVGNLGHEALEAFLSSDRSPPDCMLLSKLDGLITGVAIGPEPIMPSEWMPRIWRGEEPVFASDQEAQAVLGGIMSRYNQIIRQVADGTFEPILSKTADGDLIATDWAQGFGLAVSLRTQSWQPLLNEKRRAMLLFPIMSLGSGKDWGSALGIDAEDEAAFARVAPVILPDCIMKIAEFWRDAGPHRSQDLRQGRVKNATRLAVKPGRNDPCPCGSGLKFKRCCGP